MRCLSPRTVGFLSDGKTLCWSSKKYSKEYAPFQIPCGKCRACRLESARQTAVRCVHEAQMHEKNSFITLTYSEENLKSKKLQYRDFQLFIKRLRNEIWESTLEENREKNKIGVFCVGEYGDKNKRPHWHAIIFNWRPADAKYLRSNELGDRIFTSATLERLWPHNDSEKKPNEIGSVTLKSAGYCARYSSKKLVHGRDKEHSYNPISRRSCKNAIGKKWIEKYWPDVFTNGYVVLPNGKQCGIPRYYEKWFKKNHPEKWVKYLEEVKSKIMSDAEKKEATITLQEKKENFLRSAREGLNMTPVRTRRESEKIILDQKFDLLQKYQKDV